MDPAQDPANGFGTVSFYHQAKKWHDPDDLIRIRIHWSEA
jgi:hypothetical protein